MPQSRSVVVPACAPLTRLPPSHNHERNSMNICNFNAQPTPARTPADYAACADIWLEASLLAHDFVDPALWTAQREAMARHYLPASQVTLFRHADRPIAFAAVCRPDDEDLLAALFVAPAFWRKGFGSALLRHVQRGRARLRLDVYRANTGALAFYQSMGFAPVGESLCGHTGQPQIAMLWTAPALPQEKGL
ncbi:GCN5-related N-acetyltransferase (modular protein) [uncultured Desulfovibrio sp.]|uniref:GCN5-related N-acetyltransferase (Modular protein) n=2 Tax=Desulfovibrio TaxID=872 RepID=A0A212L688_9BACT|nr:GCN5-related N-acetyltransferase (modular protein) [uncultured Desulfovibrio sp.]VZH33788.1 GCN5-related N-acetyltransferase (Modular protein) [Desulfovibrio sp. 86]